MPIIMHIDRIHPSINTQSSICPHSSPRASAPKESALMYKRYTAARATCCGHKVTPAPPPRRLSLCLRRHPQGAVVRYNVPYQLDGTEISIHPGRERYSDSKLHNMQIKASARDRAYTGRAGSRLFVNHRRIIDDARTHARGPGAELLLLRATEGL